MGNLEKSGGVLQLTLKISILMGMEDKPLEVIQGAQNSAEAEMLCGGMSIW